MIIIFTIIFGLILVPLFIQLIIAFVTDKPIKKVWYLYRFEEIEDGKIIEIATLVALFPGLLILSLTFSWIPVALIVFFVLLFVIRSIVRFFNR